MLYEYKLLQLVRDSHESRVAAQVSYFPKLFLLTHRHHIVDPYE